MCGAFGPFSATAGLEATASSPNDSSIKDSPIRQFFFVDNRILTICDIILIHDNREMTSNNRILAGDNRILASDNTEMAGDNTEMAGDNTEMAGDNTEMASDNTEMSNDNTEMIANNRIVINDNKKVTFLRTSFSFRKKEMHNC